MWVASLLYAPETQSFFRNDVDQFILDLMHSKSALTRQFALHSFTQICNTEDSDTSVLLLDMLLKHLTPNDGSESTFDDCEEFFLLLSFLVEKRCSDSAVDIIHTFSSLLSFLLQSIQDRPITGFYYTEK